MSDYPMLISNKLHSFRNFTKQIYKIKRAFPKVSGPIKEQRTIIMPIVFTVKAGYI